MTPFKIEKSYRIRHRILENLFKDQEESGNCFKRVGSKDISSQTGINIAQLHFFHELLKENDEIDCCEEDDQHKMYIKEQGRYAYLNKKYLKEGRKLYWDNIYDPIKVILPIFTIALAVIALYLNSTTGAKIKNLERQIEISNSKSNPPIIIYKDSVRVVEPEIKNLAPVKKSGK